MFSTPNPLSLILCINIKQIRRLRVEKPLDRVLFTWMHTVNKAGYIREEKNIAYMPALFNSFNTYMDRLIVQVVRRTLVRSGQ